MNKWKSVPLTVKVSVSYAVCSILQKGISFITLSIFARMLTTSEYGQGTIYSSWLSIITIFVTLNLTYGSFSTAMVKYENRRYEYISSIQGICILLMIVFSIIYLPFSEIWNRLFELPTVIIIMMLFEIMATTSIQLWSGKKRFEYKYKSVIALTLIMSVLSPVLSYVFIVHSDEKGYAKIIGGSLITIIFGTTVFVFNLCKGKKLYNREFWIYALKFNIPLLAYYLAQFIFNQSDRIMISHYSGKDKAGIYGVAYSLATVLNFVLIAINNSYVPWFYEKLKKREQKENESVSLMISILMAVLLIGVIWFSPEIIYIVAGKKYHEAIWIVPPVAISILLLFYSQLFINFEFFFEDKKSLVKASIGAALVNVVLNAALIPNVSYLAAGYTTLFSYVIFCVANYRTMMKLAEKENIKDYGFDIKKMMMLMIIFIVLSFAGMMLYNFFLIRFVIDAIALVFLMIWGRKRSFSIRKLGRKEEKGE